MLFTYLITWIEYSKNNGPVRMSMEVTFQSKVDLRKFLRWMEDPKYNSSRLISIKRVYS